MKKIYRFFISMLAVLMLIQTVACTKKPADDQDADQSGTTAPTSAETTVPPANDQADLPENLDFDSKTFTIYSRVQSVATKEFNAELSGNIVSEAVVRRNQNLEERYNCNVENVEVVCDTNNDTMLTTVEKMINGGSSEYQIVVTAGYRMAPLAMRGMLCNINEIEGIDLGKDYYSQGYNEALSVGNAQYLVTGKMSLAYYRYMMVMLFNRSIFSDHGIEFPYQTVLDQKWTMEHAMSLSKDIYIEQDGVDGHSKGDLFGYCAFVGPFSSQTDAFMSACNLHVIEKDDNNYYRLNVNVEDFSNAVDHVLALLYSDGAYASDTINNADVLDKFVNSTAAMITFRLFCVEKPEVIKLSKTGLGYGILPVPKADEEQKDYISYVQDQCFLFGFPNSLSESERQDVGLFFEAYSSETFAIVKPAYYERALTMRYVGDEGSIRMLNIIDTNVYLDPVNVYLTAAFTFNTSSLRPIYASKMNTVSSLIASKVTSGKLEEEVAKLNEMFRKLETKS